MYEIGNMGEMHNIIEMIEIMDISCNKCSKILKYNEKFNMCSVCQINYCFNCVCNLILQYVFCPVCRVPFIKSDVLVIEQLKKKRIIKEKLIHNLIFFALSFLWKYMHLVILIHNINYVYLIIVAYFITLIEYDNYDGFNKKLDISEIILCNICFTIVTAINILIIYLLYIYEGGYCKSYDNICSMYVMTILYWFIVAILHVAYIIIKCAIRYSCNYQFQL